MTPHFVLSFLCFAFFALPAPFQLKDPLKFNSCEPRVSSGKILAKKIFELMRNKAKLPFLVAILSISQTLLLPFKAGIVSVKPVLA